MKNLDNVKPAMLYAAEEIYKNVAKIKNENPEISVVEAIEIYVESKSYKILKSGEYHNNLIKNFENNKKIVELLKIQKKLVVEQFNDNPELYFAKSSFPLSNSQKRFDTIWRFCESYELWCKEVGKKNLISLNLSN